jgi:DNA-directed RNA polymerase subunit H (RpoH/RPB5)
MSSISNSNMSNEDFMTKKAIKILYEMINDREYKIDHVDYDNEKTEPFVIRGKNDKNTILCFINDDEKLNIQGIKDKISIMNKENSEKCIIVYKNTVTSSAKKSLETLEYDVELFDIRELQLNITKHRLVPKHCKVTPSEKIELDEKYKGKLPVILSSDAISRYYCFKKGEYIRITRKDGSVIYRVVK